MKETKKVKVMFGSRVRRKTKPAFPCQLFDRFPFSEAVDFFLHSFVKETERISESLRILGSLKKVPYRVSGFMFFRLAAVA